ncbi:copper resistance protein CopC [Micromonospora sp. NPDC048909]|uniref:copper resistance CopC family protein n=1 Tax=Micromonospora sp. NPDC048909 TaxID=3155643 RepID=UPI0033D5258B
MQSTTTTLRHLLARAAATLAVVLAGVVLPAAPASAHGQLATSTPLTGSVVKQPLTELKLYFTEKPAANAHFTISGPGGTRVDSSWSPGEPKRLDKPVQEYFLVNGTFEPRLYHVGFPAVVSVAHWPATGRYTASYLSVASDGEPVRGAVAFDYRGPTTSAPAGWVPPTNEPAPELLAMMESGHTTPASPATAGTPATVSGTPAAPGAATSSSGGGIGPWLVPGIILAVVAAVVIVAARRRPSPTPAARRGSPATGARRPAKMSGRTGTAGAKGRPRRR